MPAPTSHDRPAPTRKTVRPVSPPLPIASPASPTDWPPDRVRALRVAYGWTIREAAEQVRSPRRTWSHWEQPVDQDGSRRPRGGTAMILEQLEQAARRRGLLI